MNKQQVKAIIKLLKSKELEARPALQQVFEQGGHLWATDGYICFDICEAQDELKGKRAKLQDLIAWNATHTKPVDTVEFEVFTENEHSEPQMLTLFDAEFKPSTDIRIDIDKLKLACDFMGCKSISLETSTKNDKLYRLKPLVQDEVPIIIRAMESKAYIMGLYS